MTGRLAVGLRAFFGWTSFFSRRMSLPNRELERERMLEDECVPFVCVFVCLCVCMCECLCMRMCVYACMCV